MRFYSQYMGKLLKFVPFVYIEALGIKEFSDSVILFSWFLLLKYEIVQLDTTLIWSVDGNEKGSSRSCYSGVSTQRKFPQRR